MESVNYFRFDLIKIVNEVERAKTGGGSSLDQAGISSRANSKCVQLSVATCSQAHILLDDVDDLGRVPNCAICEQVNLLRQSLLLFVTLFE